MQSYHTIIIGSGAAGLNCALHLARLGTEPTEIAIITDELGGGTSFNTGSDKQTYYKMSLIGDSEDSPEKMAHSLYDGGAMHGDIALIEATGSIQSFFNLVNLGVPFPHDKFGGFIGFKTDNDPLQRGTSIGPLTSQMMGKCLLKAVIEKGIKIINNYHVIEIIKNPSNNAASGVLAINLDNLRKTTLITTDFLSSSIEAFKSKFTVLATGGPSGMYQFSVYPIEHWGATSLAINAGAKLQNLTESQFGLASIKFRWNVSGTYQQVIPRYISIEKDADITDISCEKIEFLQTYFPSFEKLSAATFLKGYQWPFNAQRIKNHGSSLIDLAVHIETVVRGRKVYMDFSKNPEDFSFKQLDTTAYEYLSKSNALQKTPIERLNKMNPKAIQVYINHGIDIREEPLQVAVCAQHCNGGVSGDIWWQSSISRLFAVGEVNGTHGIHRPGGSALNSGQVGSLRAAQKIVFGKWNDVENDELDFHNRAENQKKQFLSIFNKKSDVSSSKNSSHKIFILLEGIQKRMMESGAYIREKNNVKSALHEAEKDFDNFQKYINYDSINDFMQVWKTYEALLTQIVFLKSIYEYLEKNGGSRGSFLVIDAMRGEKVHEKLAEIKILPENNELKEKILEIKYNRNENKNNNFSLNWTEIRNMPREDKWFETIWKEFDDREIFDENF